jgi:glycosyltransferase involved in cell wall biosynthesis
MPQFSVVVPTYDRAETIGRAVTSVLRQAAEFELIVVDDGSTDDTARILQRFDDERIRYQHQTNRGVSAARNAGASAARGEWLVFLDADDELLPDALGHFSHAAARHLLVVAGVTRVGPDHGARRTILPDRQLVLRKRFTPLLAGTFAIRAELFKKVGGYDTALPYAENTELAWRLRSHLQQGDAIEVIDEPVAVVHVQTERKHSRSRYVAAKQILARRSYEMESEDRRARREFRGNYLCIAAVSAAELGRRREAVSLAAKALSAEPFSKSRYRSAAGVARRLVWPAHQAARSPRGSSSGVDR